MKTAKMITIGEAAALSGVPPKTIRFYEEAGIIKPVARSENRYRAYSNSDVQRLRFIQRARALGFSLKSIANLIELDTDDNRTSREVKKLVLKHVAEIDLKIAEMTAIRDTIIRLADRCHGDDGADCPILNELGAVAH